MSKSKATKKPASRSHDDATVESFRRDRKFAAAYLDQVLADGDQQELMLALRRISDAYGGVSGLAQQTDLNATTLYRTLSCEGNPELRTLRALLDAMGLRLSIVPARQPKSGFAKLRGRATVKMRTEEILALTRGRVTTP